MIKVFTSVTLFLIFSIPLYAQEAVMPNDVHRSAEDIVNVKCHLCHGKKGEGSSSIYPRLAGQHKEYIA
ncbi:MAG: hypothetical protein QM504_17710, partial [Pseudomonadota bacterium]